MSDGWCSIKEKKNLKYYWAIYANNNRLVMSSGREYNTASHARDAAKRFIKLVTNTSMRKGVVRTK